MVPEERQQYLEVSHLLPDLHRPTLDNMETSDVARNLEKQADQMVAWCEQAAQA